MTQLTSRAKAHKGPDDAIAEDGGRSLCLRGMGIYSQGDSKASVHVGERGGKVEQTRGYRRDSIVVQPPYSGAADGKHATATVLVATRRVSLARGRRQHSDMVNIVAKCGQKSIKSHTKRPAWRLPRMAGDRCASAGWAYTAMVIRGCSYNWVSAVVKLNKPAGIATRALFSMSL